MAEQFLERNRSRLGHLAPEFQSIIDNPDLEEVEKEDLMVSQIAHQGDRQFRRTMELIKKNERIYRLSSSDQFKKTVQVNGKHANWDYHHGDRMGCMCHRMSESTAHTKASTSIGNAQGVAPHVKSYRSCFI